MFRAKMERMWIQMGQERRRKKKLHLSGTKKKKKKKCEIILENVLFSQLALTVDSQVTLLLLSLKLSAQLVPHPCHAAFGPCKGKTSWSSLSVCQSPVTACHYLPEKETRNGNIVFPLHWQPKIQGSAKGNHFTFWKEPEVVSLQKGPWVQSVRIFIAADNITLTLYIEKRTNGLCQWNT